MHKRKIKYMSVIAALSLIMMTGCSAKTNGNEEEGSTTKETAVSIGTIKEEISLSGSIVANKSTSVTTSSKSTVEEIYVQSGEKVLEGEDIVLLEDGTVIEAPYDGKIAKISTYINQDVDTSTSLFTIIDDSSYKIEASIDETEISKVSHGQEVDVTVTAINKEFNGKVTNIDAQASSSGNSATFGIVVTLDGEQLDEIYSGMSTEMNIIIKESKDVLVIPIQAISNRRGKHIVKVKNGEEVKEVEVEVGAQDSSFVEIKSGLQEGDIVIYEQATKNSFGNNGGGRGNMMNNGGMPGGGMPGGGMPSGERPQMPSGERPQMQKN